MIRIHEDYLQGYTYYDTPIFRNGISIPYTEDAGTTFEVSFQERKMLVSVVCDGHSGYLTAFLVVEFIPTALQECVDNASGDIKIALLSLFEKTASHVRKNSNIIGISGSTCNVTIFDISKEEVFVASLGDSPTLRYRKDSDGKYSLVWRSVDQDCSDPDEIERMVQIHRKNGCTKATKENVVFEVTFAGVPSGVWRNRHTQSMLHSSFGDFHSEYYTGIFNTIPRIYSHKWTRQEQSDIWIQCTDGLLEWLSKENLGIQPCGDFRVKEIATHLNSCDQSDNIARDLHSAQVDSMLRERTKAHPKRKDNTREWIEKNFDNHHTKVFMW